jgi:hypothetical protein
MSYSPINTPVYTAAFNGAIAGFYGAQFNDSTYYAELADAWAQAIDQAWDNTPYTAFELLTLTTCSIVRWQNQPPQEDGLALNPAAYAAAAAQIVALAQAGQAQLVAEGISPVNTGLDIIANDIYGGGDYGVIAFNGTNVYSFATLSGSTYTVNRDLFAADGSSVSAGITVITNGFRFFCNGTLTNNGTIHDGGANAVASVAGAHSPVGTLGIGTAGGMGANNAAGSPGTNQGSTLQDAALAGECIGGAGGAAGANAGGAAGTYTASGASGGSNYLFPDMTGCVVTQTNQGNQALLTVIGGGSGGGGGASDNAGATGGGGGGAGGVVQLTVLNLINNGLVHANGGNGGNASGAVGNAGGGGGGGGGVIQSLSRYRSGTGTFSVTGGMGGTGVGTGAAGANGAVGHINRHTA